MKRVTQQTLVALTTALLLAPLAALNAADVPKPNILYIVADDMGYADCGVQGCKDVPTPHIDSIAMQRHPFHRRLRFGHGLQPVARGPDDRTLSLSRWNSQTGCRRASRD